MEFFTPGLYNRMIPEGIPNIDGTVVFPAAKPLDKMIGKDLDDVEYYQRRLLDPQLYLYPLDPALCSVKCTNLMTYPWFDPGDLATNRTTSVRAMQKWIRKARGMVHDHWPTALPAGQARIDAVRAAFATQDSIGCEALIIPAPLTTDLNSNLGAEVEWLDDGIAIGRAEFNRPLIASIAISDRALRDLDPYDNRLVDTFLDQVTAREPDGVYIVVEVSGEAGYYWTSQGTVGALLRLVDGLKRGGIPRVIVNYATVAGLLAFAVGADTWCTGWYQSERRLKLDDFINKPPDPISSYPAFYSHRLAGEIHMRDDFDRLMVEEGLFGELADETRYSSQLLEAVRKGLASSSVYDWQFVKSRVTFAKAHFSSAMARESATLAALNGDERLRYADLWLGNALRLAVRLNAVEHLHPRTEIRHQRSWRRAFDAFVDKR
jgi:hypothetical protein